MIIATHRAGVNRAISENVPAHPLGPIGAFTALVAAHRRGDRSGARAASLALRRLGWSACPRHGSGRRGDPIAAFSGLVDARERRDHRAGDRCSAALRLAGWACYPLGDGRGS